MTSCLLVSVDKLMFAYVVLGGEWYVTLLVSFDEAIISTSLENNGNI